MTLLEILRASTDYLARSRIDSARLEAEVLLAHVLGLERLDLYLQFERPLTEPELESLRSLLRRRVLGTPLAYLTGEREFFGLRFSVSDGVLIPRPESELVVELALARLAAKEGALVGADLGTGSGCLGIAIAVKAPAASIDAVDISEAAVEVARSNAAHLGVSSRVTVIQGSWGQPLEGRGLYNLIVSNPPYVTRAELMALEPEVRDFEPRLALDAGPDGLAPYRELLVGLPKLAAPDATILLEVDPKRSDAVAKLASDTWAAAEPKLHHDLSGRERVLEVTLG
ncbi:MAG: peptide chain release factor N(5)-glutamine methyltransferase [Candidatus Dormiibacterota bacterium]